MLESNHMVLIFNSDKSMTNLIYAHESTIACLALNSDGSLLASASDKVLINIIKGNIDKNFQIR